MDDISLVVKSTTKLEDILEHQYGAQGVGLTAKARSVESELPRGVLERLPEVVRVRNLVVHKHEHVPFKSEQERVSFIKACGEIERQLVGDMSHLVRNDGRRADELRAVRITPGFMPYAEGSALIEMGNTRVICTATLDERVPPFRRNTGQGWLTAEYAMLPRATQQRTQRETGRGGPSGRTHEIQRLIGRSLRAVTNLSKLGERTITIDCDVLQADGGTRTASITGAYVALVLACRRLVGENKLSSLPVTGEVAAVSVGMVAGVPLLDLKYDEDSRAEVDMNVVCTGDGRFVELQGTAEGEPFSQEQTDALLALARGGLRTLFDAQRAAFAQAGR